MTPRIYLVGGAVRDTLLGIEPKDRDYVVVGADADYMLARGFSQVGASFPVFLHPDTGEEYALARQERKVRPGYHGFEVSFGPDVSLQDDLIRRDLTINSMALDPVTGELVDPFNGKRDLENGILRHTSSAFAEDPLRVLRVARFVARYNFKVAALTLDLMEKLVDELQHLAPERIWTELEKIFSEPNTDAAIEVLQTVGATAVKSTLLNYLFDSRRVNEAHSYSEGPINTSKLTADEKMLFHLALETLSLDEVNRLKVPRHVWKRAIFTENLQKLTSGQRAPERIVEFFDRYRQEVTGSDLEAAEDFYVKVAHWAKPSYGMSEVRKGFRALKKLDLTETVKGVEPKAIKEIVRTTKVAAVREAWKRR